MPKVVSPEEKIEEFARRVMEKGLPQINRQRRNGRIYLVLRWEDGTMSAGRLDQVDGRAFYELYRTLKETYGKSRPSSEEYIKSLWKSTRHKVERDLIEARELLSGYVGEGELGKLRDMLNEDLDGVKPTEGSITAEVYSILKRLEIHDDDALVVAEAELEGLGKKPDLYVRAGNREMIVEIKRPGGDLEADLAKYKGSGFEGYVVATDFRRLKVLHPDGEEEETELFDPREVFARVLKLLEVL